MSKKSKHWLAYSGLGIQMAVTMLFCLWIGIKIENYFSISPPLGQLGGLFFGIFASIYNLINSVK
jgi:hypothetical protein|tara:strand:- start:1970 stop:2164 length:195 start_codon:yes stop_codon:yes gene_type:complete